MCKGETESKGGGVTEGSVVAGAGWVLGPGGGRVNEKQVMGGGGGGGDLPSMRTRGCARVSTRACASGSDSKSDSQLGWVGGCARVGGALEKGGGGEAGREAGAEAGREGEERGREGGAQNCANLCTSCKLVHKNRIV